MILVIGLGSAVVLWRAQDKLEREEAAARADNPSGPLAPLDSGKHVRDVEIYYGKAGLLMEQADELFHGKPLAKTIGISSMLIATGLFLLAARVSE